jgi:hypothetical protein
MGTAMRHPDEAFCEQCGLGTVLQPDRVAGWVQGLLVGVAAGDTAIAAPPGD